MKATLPKTKKPIGACIMVVLAMLFNACQKNELPTAVQDFNGRGMATKIHVWLDKQIAATTRKDRKDNLENLKNNLHTKSLWVEDLRLGKKFIIVPISEGMEIKANKGKPVTSYFVARIDVNGNITEGNLMQYAMPNSPVKIPMPVNALHDFYNFRDYTGVFTYITLKDMDRVSFEMEYRNDKLYRVTSVDAKQNIKALAGNSQLARETPVSCVDYYEATDWYDQLTGELMNTTYTFLYTDCSGGTGGGSNPSNPGGPGTGNGGVVIGVPGGTVPGGGPMHPESDDVFEPASDISTWRVSKSPNGAPSWDLWSTENFTGLKAINNPSQNKIGSITHSLSFIDIGSSYYPATWSQSGWAGNVSGDSVRANAKISGIVNYPINAPYPNIIIREKLHSWKGSTLFP